VHRQDVEAGLAEQGKLQVGVGVSLADERPFVEGASKLDAAAKERLATTVACGDPVHGVEGLHLRRLTHVLSLWSD
jgi:hypothetical protein